MKIVVTGALGHIGSRLIREIPDYFKGAEVVMIDNLMTMRYSSLFNLPSGCNYKFVEKDISTNDIGEYIKGSDVLIHLAAITDAAGSVNKKDELEKNNYNSTVKVATACAENNVPMIHISSTSVYGTQKELVDEDCGEEDLKPQSPYADTKIREERFMAELATKGDFKFAICRFGTIAGISVGMRFHTAVNKFCWQAVMGEPITVWRTALHQKRPYLALGEAVRALMFIVENKVFDGRVYNVLSENLTVDNIIKTIEKYLPNQEINYVDTEIMNQLSYEVSCERFKDLGFQFKNTIEENIEETLLMLAKSNGKDIKK